MICKIFNLLSVEPEKDEYVKEAANELYKNWLTPLLEEDFQKWSELESSCLNYAASSEQYGFVKGFKTAIRLILECNSK